MIWPKHKDPTQSHRRAKAPYNFVPLPEKVVPAELLLDESTYYPDRHTGWLDCTLTTASPLYVRCGVLPSQFDQVEAKDLPEFFYTDPDILEPVIPGSSLRGMLRVMVEIVGYGKVQPVTNELKITFRAVAASRQDPLAGPYQGALGKFGRNVKVGYLQQQGDQWFVRPAHRPSDFGLSETGSYLKVKERDIENDAIPGLIKFNGQGYQPQYHDVSFDTEERRDKNGRRYVAVVRIGSKSAEYRYSGVLVCSGNMLETSGGGTRSPRKNHALVLEPDSKAKTVPVSKQAVQDYLDSLTEFQKEPPFNERRGCLIEGRPIFYIEHHGQAIMFGHCPNFRVPARLAGQERAATSLDFVPEVLHDPSQTDLAEAMFGYVEPKENAGRPVAHAGRVFVSDAVLEPGQKNVWLSDQPITPKILGGPKPTTFQHYLVQTEPEERSHLAHYASPTPQETVIRGHKLYWHKGEVKQADFEESDPTKRGDSQHTSIKPVRSDIRFHFCIRFENLSNAELGALLWLLDIAKDTNYRLKLGMGKPLGMGAVKVEAQLHLTDRVSRYASLFEGDAWAIGTRTDADAVWHKAVQAFEQRVLSDPEVNPHSVSSLVEVERAKMLLWMLSWPGPSSDQTRYLEIEHPVNKNEYKDRPVLPTPLGVIGVDTTTPTRSPASPPKQRVERKPTPDLPTSVSHPASVNEIKQGDLLEGRVIAVEPNRVVIDVGVAKGSMGLEQLNRLVQVDEWFRRTYPGQTLTAQALYEKGELEDIMVGTRMQVLVRKVEMIQGKPKIKLSFVAWMAK